MKHLKIFFILSTLYAFINSICETEEEESYRYRDYKDCINRAFSSEEIENGAYKCCYLEVEYKTVNTETEVHGCVSLNRTQFENIRQTERILEMAVGVEDAEIECESSFMKLGIFIFCFISYLII